MATAVVNFCFRDTSNAGNVGIANQYTTLSGSLRFKAADNNTGASTDDPLVRPSSGTYYSFSKNIRARVVTNPTVALLALRVKLSAVPSGVTGLDLAYSFRTVASVYDNLAVVLPARQGVLGTSDVNWLNGRTTGGTGGTSVPNHVVGTAGHTAGNFWADTASDQLLLSMEVGVGDTNGGAITPFNLIASYNEI